MNFPIPSANGRSFIIKVNCRIFGVTHKQNIGITNQNIP